MCVTPVWDDPLKHGNKTKWESELAPFSQLCWVNWINQQFAGSTVLLLHKDVGVLLRVWSFCGETSQQVLSDQSIVGRVKERMKLIWSMGDTCCRHVPPGHFSLSHVLFGFCFFVFIVSSPLCCAGTVSPASSSQISKKSYAALWAWHSAPLILYNSAQRHTFCPLTAATMEENTIQPFEK